jgi:prohibitin 2
MAYDPREHLQRLQRTLQQRGGGGGGFGGVPGGAAAGRGVLGLIALGIGGVILSNSIFNGETWYSL